MVELDPPQLSHVFHGQSDATRRGILLELASGELTVGQVAQPSLAAASKHIKVLESAGLIHSKARGRSRTARKRPRAADLVRALLDRPAAIGSFARWRRVTPPVPSSEDQTPIPREGDNQLAKLDAYSAPSEPAALTIQRILPGPIVRVWAYLTESDFPANGWRRVNGDEGRHAFELIWRNSELTGPARQAAGRIWRRAWLAEPDHRARSATQTRLHLGKERRPHLRARAEGREVSLTVIHRRLPDRGMMLGVSVAWHADPALLVARPSGNEPEPFWDGWSRLKAEYDRRIPI
jgi:DNA-binding transcriptional ArsR family regulator/uncharacterized protein YndB with AHSA1/START domain